MNSKTIKDYGDITPNTAFTANALDLADTQFTNIKFLCTTDVYNLKVPTTMKNFYCDSAMDIDTDVIEDASYEVIHEELIEPYTTNYVGEVVSYDLIQVVYYANAEEWVGQYTVGSGKLAEGRPGWMSTVGSTDYIPIKEGAPCSIRVSSGKCGIIFFNESKEFIGYVGQANESNTNLTTTAVEDSKYVMFWYDYAKYTGGGSSKYYATIEYKQPYTPNIIPSSANGSLIFNMYSNNTIQPTSTSPYMWDLTGLKLEDFYTYGMNNWVKQDESGNITMPQRMSGYSVRLVNADVTPDEYPTMLYPKLIDTMLPITGKLDYTKYNGSSLAWAYAYTTDDVNLSKLEDESNITCDYNKEATLTDAQEAALLSIFDEEVNN